MAFDIIIKNGTVFDGVKDEGCRVDVGIAKDKIKEIGNLQRARGEVVIDAAGKYVAPGFIDIQNHSDSYMTLLDMPSQESLVKQGVTTIIMGHCGTSLAPLPQPGALKSVQKWHSTVGANVDWLTFEEYLTALEKYQFGVNVASLAGHATVRRGIVGDAPRSATAQEIKIINNILAKSMEAGGGGVSLGLVYAHEVDSSNEELESAAAEAGKRKKLVSLHLRSDSNHVVSAVNEAILLAGRSEARVKISHLKIRGKENWTYISEILAFLDRAYQQGTDIFFDVYPYTTSWAVLYTYLPKWAYEGGRAAILQNLRGAKRKDILAYLREQEHDLGSILIANSETNPGLTGRTLGQVARDHETDAAEALLAVIASTNAQAVVFDHNLSPKVNEMLLRHPLSVVATDGAGYEFAARRRQGFPHPRCFGTFPKFLSMVRENSILKWGEAVKKITSHPAEKIGLSGRGRLVAGAFADVVVFDPEKIASTSSYENPFREPSGINQVLVNGQPSGQEQRAGKIIRL